MKSSIEYRSFEKNFSSRSDLIGHCIENKEQFENFSFIYKNLPRTVEFKENEDLIWSTKKWLFDLKRKNKPLVLMFSGGIDSAFALECMIENNCPPDFILIYTFDPFDDNSLLSPYNMESKLGIEYINTLKKKYSCLKNTNIWHIHLDSHYMNMFFNDLDWPLNILGYEFSLNSPTLWFNLPEIDNWNEFTFIKGGDMPKLQINHNNALFFYIVDKQLGERLDFTEKKCYDFILDNKSLFSSLCNILAKNHFTQNRNFQMPYNSEYGNKYLIEHFLNLVPNIPPQLDKRFSSLTIPFSDESLSERPLEMLLNERYLKEYLFYLRAEKETPNWYKKYKQALSIHKDWILTSFKFPGKISQKIPLMTD